MTYESLEGKSIRELLDIYYDLFDSPDEAAIIALYHRAVMRGWI